MHPLRLNSISVDTKPPSVPKMNYTSKEFNQDLFALVKNEVFLAHCIAQISRKPTELLPTAAIGFDKKNNRFTMWYNPGFMGELSTKHRRGVILHELFHFINHHITTRMPDPKYMKIWNYATDLAINDHIKHLLPEFCLVPGQGPFSDTEKWRHNQTADFYFEIFKERQDEMESLVEEMMEQAKAQEGESGDPGNSFFDNHDEWLTDPADADMSNSSHEIAKQKAKQIMQKAANEASKTSDGWGTISAAMRQKIVRSLQPQISWRSVLRSFVQTSQKASKRNSVMRVNRRKPYVRPGQRQSYVANIAVAVDMSGSVEDELLSKFFAEIDGLAKHVTFTVLPFDTKVIEEHCHVHEKGSRSNYERVFCGGTDFQCVTDYVNEHKQYDALIVLTDLGAPQPGPCRVKRMWLADEQNAASPYFNPKTLNERLLVVK
jgi:predicted metal-dependent peptidase